MTKIELKNGKWLINNSLYENCKPIEQDVFDTRLASRELATRKKKKKKEKVSGTIQVVIFALVTMFLLFKLNQLCKI